MKKTKTSRIATKTATDNWCDPIRSDKGRMVYGGAARGVRIAALGGMAAILKRVSRTPKPA